MAMTGSRDNDTPVMQLCEIPHEGEIPVKAMLMLV